MLLALGVDGVGVSSLRMSMGMAVPVRPRNCDSAEVRYVRAVRASRGSALQGRWRAEEGAGWVILSLGATWVSA